MAINDTAMRLANEIKSSKEYKEFIRNMNEIKKDKESEKLLQDYRVIQLQISNYSINNKQIDKKTINKVNIIKNKVASNKKLCNYLNSEQQFNKMMEEINKILIKVVERDYIK